MRWRRSWRIGKRRFWGAGRLRGMIRRLGGCLLAVCLSRAERGYSSVELAGLLTGLLTGVCAAGAIAPYITVCDPR